MANYSANQYEKAFSAKYLQNWSPARPTKESIPAHEGYTQIIANDRGHLLPSVPRSKVRPSPPFSPRPEARGGEPPAATVPSNSHCNASPWGSFMGTWQMPLRIPPARVSLTSRSAAGAAALTAWIQKDPDFLKASNGLRPEILGKVPTPPAAPRTLGSQFQLQAPVIPPLFQQGALCPIVSPA
ncbi:protein Flattop isoform X3 [Phyllostomus discolor]|uniref:Protein Flattop n=1 Tax=Phyllostomus discolor TaxID=89673 RepID=A0A7E6CXV3_9CHIR|nr:protein Flattop isoform X3 [Phyllostomus discolor]